MMAQSDSVNWHKLSPPRPPCTTPFHRSSQPIHYQYQQKPRFPKQKHKYKAAPNKKQNKSLISQHLRSTNNILSFSKTLSQRKKQPNPETMSTTRGPATEEFWYQQSKWTKYNQNGRMRWCKSKPPKWFCTHSSEWATTCSSRCLSAIWLC